MRQFFLLLLLLGALSLSVSAQCERDEYRIILDLAKQDLQDRIYQRAINRLLDARDICPDEKEVVNGLIKKAFEQIEGEKAAAITARQEAEAERQRADSAQQVANRVLDQMYFYEGKFGLTLKNVAEEGEPWQYRYGFIDRNGIEVLPFEFVEATPFSASDGFARVIREGEKCLLDTAGTTYLLATSLADLSPETEALELIDDNRSDSLPADMGKYPNLKVILAYIGSIWRLPASIGQLSQLRHLDLRHNQLTTLPPEIGNLSQLQELDLFSNDLTILPPEIGQLSQLQKLKLGRSLGISGGNKLTMLPPEIGNLSQLRELDVSYNQLTTLPPEIGQLSQLRELDLSGNDLTTLPPEIGNLSQLQELDLFSNDLTILPPEIGQLSQLQTLSLSGNQLTTLPPEIGNLKKLRYLRLRNNPLPEAEQARIRELLPGCEIKF